MENKKNDPLKEKEENPNYGSDERGITNDQIEDFEIGQESYERQLGKKPLDVSTSEMDSSTPDKGNLVVQKSVLTDEEKRAIDEKTDRIEGGGDIGEGRASGADRP